MTAETLLNKSQVIDSFQNLPEQVSADELIERILFIRLISERMEKAQHNAGTLHDEFMREFSEFRTQLKARRSQGLQ